MRTDEIKGLAKHINVGSYPNLLQEVIADMNYTIAPTDITTCRNDPDLALRRFTSVFEVTWPSMRDSEKVAFCNKDYAMGIKYSQEIQREKYSNPPSIPSSVATEREDIDYVRFV